MGLSTVFFVGLELVPEFDVQPVGKSMVHFIKEHACQCYSCHPNIMKQQQELWMLPTQQYVHADSIPPAHQTI
jgi:hypothetical protein